MTNPPDSSPTGARRWRHRVRLLTAGVLGAAVLATGGVTALLASGQDVAASTPTAAADSSAAGSSAAGSSVGGSTSDDQITATGTGSGSLSAPAQAPAGAAGQGHATTGGS
jgi:hypothetical protein